jgi:hypothetical protein
MARTDVPVKRISRLSASYFTAAQAVNGDTVNGMRMVNNGATVLVVSNSNVAAQTIDTIIVETIDFQPAGPVTITVGGSAAFAVIGPFPADIYGNVLEFDVSNASLDFGGFSLL